MTKFLLSRYAIRRSSGGRVRSMVRRAALLALAMTMAFGALSAKDSQQASAFRAPFGAPFPGIRIYYSIDPSFAAAGFLVPSLYAAEQKWKSNGLIQNAEFYNDPAQPGAGNRVITTVGGAFGIDGWGPTRADATMPCLNNSSTCTMRFELGFGNLWNTTANNTDNAHGWIDFIAFATHEFGHFLGLDHSTDLIASDWSRTPTMECCSILQNYRSIQADDENGLRAARPTAPGNLVANPGFEYRPLENPGPAPAWGGWDNRGWTWAPRSASAASALYSGGAIEGALWVEFNNGGGPIQSSFSQDIRVNGYPTGAQVTPRVFLRDPADLGATATLAVWNMTNSPAVLVGLANSSPGAGWTEVSMAPFTVFAGNRYRIEIYNNSPTRNLDVDFARLNFN